MKDTKGTKSKVEYDMEYAKKHIKRVPLDMQLDAYKELQAAADKAGEKVNTYIKKAIAQRMEREQAGGSIGIAPAHPKTAE